VRVESIFGKGDIASLINEWIRKNEDRYIIIDIKFVPYGKGDFITAYILYKEFGFDD
jgi:hypothetical protein